MIEKLMDGTKFVEPESCVLKGFKEGVELLLLCFGRAALCEEGGEPLPKRSAFLGLGGQHPSHPKIAKEGFFLKGLFPTTDTGFGSDITQEAKGFEKEGGFRELFAELQKDANFGVVGGEAILFDDGEAELGLKREQLAASFLPFVGAIKASVQGDHLFKGGLNAFGGLGGEDFEEALPMLDC